jgi:hypothetical protein
VAAFGARFALSARDEKNKNCSGSVEILNQREAKNE